MNIILVDDHSLFRDGLKAMLELDEDVRVVAESGSATEALDTLSVTRVELAVVDLNLPDQDGVWLLSRIREKWPSLPVLVLSMNDGSHDVLRAMAAGANGYLTKTVKREELMAAIRTVLEGGTHLSRAASRPVLERLTQLSPAAATLSLTERELAILQLVISGKNNSEIAKEISLSISRVKFHLGELFNKFSVNDRTSLAVEAAKAGF